METAPNTNAGNFFKDSLDTFIYLYGRWQDEKKYENIDDYAKPLASIAEKHGVTEIKMTKRPFGCTFAVDGKRYKLTINSRTAGYNRIA